MDICDLRLRIAFSAIRTDLRASALREYVLYEDEEMLAKQWLVEHQSDLEALIEAAADFTRAQGIEGTDIAAIAFLNDTAVLYPCVQTLLRLIPLLREDLLEKLNGKQDELLRANMRAIAQM